VIGSGAQEELAIHVWGRVVTTTRCPPRQPLESPRELKMTTTAIVDFEFCCGYALFLLQLIIIKSALWALLLRLLYQSSSSS
jgi:hypothetical protein